MSHDAGFDARLRDVHAQSLERLSPRVQAQLVQRRRAALQGTAVRRPRALLPWAGMATAGLALALVVQLRPPSTPSRTSTPVVAAASASRSPATSITAAPAARAAVDTRMASRTDADAIAPDLTQDPEFYLWLGDTRPTNAE